jgi:hypothetical protein
VLSLPVHHRSQPPRFRLGDLDPSAIGAALVLPDRDGTDRQASRPTVAGLELGGRGKVHAFGVGFAPRLVTRLKPRLTSCRVRARLSVLRRATRRAAFAPGDMRRLAFEGFPTPLALLFHGAILAFSGLGTVPVRALAAGREAVGVELNCGYFLDAVAYLQAEERKQGMPSLFDAIDELTEAA